MATDREERESLIVLLHNCAAEYQPQTLARIHYSYLQRAAHEMALLMRENEHLREALKIHGEMAGEFRQGD